MDASWEFRLYSAWLKSFHEFRTRKQNKISSVYLTKEKVKIREIIPITINTQKIVELMMFLNVNIYQKLVNQLKVRDLYYLENAKCISHTVPSVRLGNIEKAEDGNVRVEVGFFAVYFDAVPGIEDLACGPVVREAFCKVLAIFDEDLGVAVEPTVTAFMSPHSHYDITS